MDTPIAARLKKALETHPTIDTAAALSRASKVTEATVSNWLGNKVQEEQAKGLIGVKLARALGVRVEWLFTGELPMRSSEGAPGSRVRPTLDSEMVRETYRVLRQIYGVRNDELPHLIEREDVAARFVQLYSMRESILSHQSLQDTPNDGARIHVTDEQGMQSNGRNDGVPTHGTGTAKMARRTGNKTKA